MNKVVKTETNLKRAEYSFTLFVIMVALSVVMALLFASCALLFSQLGKFYKPLLAKSHACFRFGVVMVFKAQPWLRATFKVNVPKTSRSLLFVSNHRSHLDVYTYLAQIPGLRIVARASLFKVPGLGLAMRLMRNIPLARHDYDSLDNCIATVRRGMKNGDSILLFPELTRCEKGTTGTNKFITLPFIIAKQENALVVPLVVSGTDDIWPKGITGFNRHKAFKSVSLAPVDAMNFSSAKELKEAVQDQINKALLDAGSGN